MSEVIIICAGGRGKLQNFFINWLKKVVIRVKNVYSEKALNYELKKTETQGKKVIVFSKKNLCIITDERVMFVNVFKFHPRDCLKKINRWLGRENSKTAFFVPVPMIEFYQNKISCTPWHLRLYHWLRKNISKRAKNILIGD